MRINETQEFLGMVSPEVRDHVTVNSVTVYLAINGWLNIRKKPE